MEHDIISKLDAHLRCGIQNECDVVYLLVEIRKLLERSKQKGKYGALCFYCDWVVHTELDRAGAFSRLQEFDAAVGAMKHDPDEIQTKLVEKLRGLIELGDFRSELEELLASAGLPTDFPRDASAWSRFLGLYADVVQDCPLVYSNDGQKPPKLQNVDKITLRRHKPVNSQSPFAMRWDVTFKDQWATSCYFMPKC